MKYLDMFPKTILSKAKPHFPWDYELNIYRGCAHHCNYCYAMYSHQFINPNNKDFFNTIYIKQNCIELLAAELPKPKYKQALLCIGTVCDAYQPIEKDLQLMRQVLKLCIQHHISILISTKSSLLLRDLDLLQELSQVAYVRIDVSITCADQRIASILEPNASSTAQRFTILEQLQPTQIPCGIRIMPLVPGFNDTSDNIEKLLYQASQLGVDYCSISFLHLHGQTKKYFMNFLNTTYPHLYAPYQKLYPKGSLHPHYHQRKTAEIASIRKKYPIRLHPHKRKPKENIEMKQLRLF